VSFAENKRTEGKQGKQKGSSGHSQSKIEQKLTTGHRQQKLTTGHRQQTDSQKLTTGHRQQTDSQVMLIN
jgi:hypothetical protein